MKPIYILCGMSVAAIWGFNFIVIHWGLECYSPIILGALRFFFVSFPLIFFVGKPCVPWRHLLVYGLVLGVFYFGSLFIAIDVGMPAGLASVVIQSQALFTALLSIALLKEKMKPATWLGLSICLLGLALIGFEKQGTNSQLGLMYTIFAAFFFAVSNILLKQYNPPKPINFLVWVSVVPILPLLLLSYKLEGIDALLCVVEQVHWKGVFSVAYIAYISTIVGFAFWSTLMRHYPANMVAPFGLLVPVTGILSSYLILNEKVSLIEAWACALIILGLSIVMGFHKRIKKFVQRTKSA